MSQINISNVINISVSTAQAGIGEYNTSNLAIFSREAFAPATFGALGYKIYLDPSEVAVDFGTGSETYAMALAVFSQQPNILAGGGYLVVIPFSLAIQQLTFGSTPVTGAYVISYDGNPTSSLDHAATASDVQTALRLLSGLSAVTVTGSNSAGFVITMTGVAVPHPLLITTNTTTQTTVIGSTELLAAAITRTQGLVQYFGLMAAEITSQTNMLAAAAVVQTLNKIAAFVSQDSASVSPGGLIDLLRTGSFTQSRGLYYGTGAVVDALVYMASYMALGLSVNFNGSNTTSTMHLKDLAIVQPDLTVDQTLLNACQLAGADVYISIQGVPKTYISGANKFFDSVYNLRWFVGALQVAGFNYLAETNTKVAQTENGVTGLKNAYRQVAEQGVTNQYIAPGAWNSPTTFGNQQDLILNVGQRGYYIYSGPISQQLPSVRASRQAPIIQIAIKEAGAIQESTVIVNVNA